MVMVAIVTMLSLRSSCLLLIRANDCKRLLPLLCVFVMAAARKLGISFTI